MCRQSDKKGIIFVALGLGLIVSLIFPTKYIIIFLALALVASGIALSKA